MYLFFIDESGTPPSKQKENPEKFILGGIIISDETWFKVKEDLVNLKAKYNIHPEAEIKWRYFSPHNNDKASGLKGLLQEERNSYRDKIFEIIKRYKSIKVIGVVVDTKSAYDKPFITNKNELYSYAYKAITERFQYYV